MPIAPDPVYTHAVVPLLPAVNGGRRKLHAQGAAVYLKQAGCGDFAIIIHNILYV